MNSKNKHGIVLLVLVLAFFLSGCSFSPPSLLGSDEPPKNAAREGNKGLVMSFFEGAPPENAFSGEDIKIALLLENRGYYPVVSSEGAKISVFSGGIIDIGQVNCNNINLEERTSISPGGRSNCEASATITGVKADTDALIFAVACYDYETRLSETVCIDVSDYTTAQNRKACEVSDITLTDQGAPIAITRIEQSKSVSDGKTLPRFKIFLKNVGGGILTPRESAEKFCGEADSGNEEVYINAEGNVADKSLNCDPKSGLSGDPDRDFIECRVDDGFDKGGLNFITTLDIALTYGYQSTISKRVMISGSSTSLTQNCIPAPDCYNVRGATCCPPSSTQTSPPPPPPPPPSLTQNCIPAPDCYNVRGATCCPPSSTQTSPPPPPPPPPSLTQNCIPAPDCYNVRGATCCPPSSG